MIKIITRFGALYMEKPSEREETDRIKFYDSKERYLDYLSLESISPALPLEHYCKEIEKDLEAMESMDALLSYLGIRVCNVSECWTDLLEDIYGSVGYKYYAETDKYIELSDGTEITEYTLLENEFVNKIGNTFILICD